MEWEKLKEETNLAYEWFCRYRDYGPERSMQKILQKYAMKNSYLRQLKLWSKKHGWVARAEAYDLHIEKLKRTEMENEQVKAAKEHIKLADSFMDVVWEALPKLKGARINALQLRSLAEFAVKTKRDALGIAEKHEISTEVDVNDKFVERLSKELLEKTDKILAIRDEVLDDITT